MLNFTSHFLFNGAKLLTKTLNLIVTSTSDHLQHLTLEVDKVDSGLLQLRAFSLFLATWSKHLPRYLHHICLHKVPMLINIQGPDRHGKRVQCILKTLSAFFVVHQSTINQLSRPGLANSQPAHINDSWCVVHMKEASIETLNGSRPLDHREPSLMDKHIVSSQFGAFWMDPSVLVTNMTSKGSWDRKSGTIQEGLKPSCLTVGSFSSCHSIKTSAVWCQRSISVNTANNAPIYINVLANLGKLLPPNLKLVHGIVLTQARCMGSDNGQLDHTIKPENQPTWVSMKNSRSFFAEVHRLPIFVRGNCDNFANPNLSTKMDRLATLKASRSKNTVMLGGPLTLWHASLLQAGNCNFLSMQLLI